MSLIHVIHPLSISQHKFGGLLRGTHRGRPLLCRKSVLGVLTLFFLTIYTTSFIRSLTLLSTFLPFLPFTCPPLISSSTLFHLVPFPVSCSTLFLCFYYCLFFLPSCPPSCRCPPSCLSVCLSVCLFNAFLSYLTSQRGSTIVPVCLPELYYITKLAECHFLHHPSILISLLDLPPLKFPAISNPLIFDG